jgi:hypothetical protein
VNDGDPPRVPFSGLKGCVRTVALGCIVLRHWPGSRSRHDFALRIAGVLARAGWEEANVTYFVATIASEAGDDEVEDRRRAAADTVTAHAGGAKVYGLTGLKEHLDERVVKQIAKVLEYNEIDNDAALERMRPCTKPAMR